MNSYYDDTVLKKAIIPMWMKLFLRVFVHPTYVSFESGTAVFWKKFMGKVYIIGSESIGRS